MLTAEGALLNCHLFVQDPWELTCNITQIYMYESGVYWCEFGIGVYSNAINVTVSGMLMTG